MPVDSTQTTHVSGLRQQSLVADIGGTNARFAAADLTARRLYAERAIPTRSARTMTALVASYLRDWDGPPPLAACLAVAAPVVGDMCTFTNAGLRFSVEATRRQLQLRRLLVVNDFCAAARAVPELGPTGLAIVGDQIPAGGGVQVAIGPGTGLGVATMVAAGEGIRILPGEGGHVALAALYDDELEIVRVLRRRFGFASAESVLSGDGLVRLHDALVSDGTEQSTVLTPGEIIRRAVDGSEAAAVRALTVFWQLLAVIAANVALTVGAVGGVFVAGGIAPRCVEFIRASGFRDRFESHPQMGSYLAQIPTAVVVDPYPGLRGALHLLHDAGLAA